MKSKLVSIVIPTKNSAEYLKKCLTSIQNQSYPHIEIIVVDNFSTDSTQEIAKKFTRNVFNKGPERSSQRNYGVKKSKGSYVAIIDSDMILTKNVVRDCIRICNSNREVVQITLPEKSIGEGYWSKVKAYERSFYLNDDTIEAPRFFAKKVFEEVGGYDESIHGGGEEYDLPDRITARGYARHRINSFTLHQEGKLTLLETMNTKYYYGKTAYIYYLKHKKKALIKMAPVRKSFLSHWPRLIRHPILSISMIYMKLCELGAGGIGFTQELLKYKYSHYEKCS